MGTVRLHRLEDLERWSSELRIRCPKCKHEALYLARDMVRLFKSERWNTSLDVAPYRFRCSLCGHKPCKMSGNSIDFDMPEVRPRPKHLQPAPYGLDPEQWAKATDAERKKMLDRLR